MLLAGFLLASPLLLLCGNGSAGLPRRRPQRCMGRHGRVPTGNAGPPPREVTIRWAPHPPTKNYWALECFACLTRGPLFGRFRSRAHCSVHHPPTTPTASAKPPSVGPTPATCHVGVCHVQDQIASAPAAVLATTNSKPTLPLTL